MRSLRLVALATVVGLTPLVRADDGFAKFLSGPGTWIYCGTAVGLPLVRDGDQARNHCLRAMETLGISVGAAEGLKRLTHVKRPDSDSYDSFPSGHATAAFSVATMEASFHPKEAVIWYAGAALIANSRLTLGRHRFLDVAAGAALGFLTAKYELSQRNGILFRPWITEDGGFGAMLSMKF